MLTASSGIAPKFSDSLAGRSQEKTTYTKEDLVDSIITKQGWTDDSAQKPFRIEVARDLNNSGAHVLKVIFRQDFPEYAEAFRRNLANEAKHRVEAPAYSIINEDRDEREEMIVLGEAERGPGVINILAGKDLYDSYGHEMFRQIVENHYNEKQEEENNDKHNHDEENYTSFRRPSF